MAGKVGQAAGKVASKANEAGSGKGKDSALQKGAKKDPELYVRTDHSIVGWAFAHACGRSSSRS